MSEILVVVYDTKEGRISEYSSGPLRDRDILLKERSAYCEELNILAEDNRFRAIEINSEILEELICRV